MKISIRSVFLLFICTAVLLSGCGSASTPVPSTPAASPIPSTFTPESTITATLIPSSPTPQPTVVPTLVSLPQQWNGVYTYPGSGKKQLITLLILAMDGTTFSGQMIWMPFGRSRGATLRMNGEYMTTDFGDETEQIRWNNLEDYKNKVEGGSWLKWTETETISGRNYTVNGWYYAHIRDDGTMVAVYFFNDTEILADAGTFVLKQALP
jgi:hypothetical protein